MPAAVPYALPGATGVAVALGAGPVQYKGFTARETAGATAVFRLRDGTVTGAILETVAFAAGQSSSDYFAGDGVSCMTGTVYYQLVSGTVEGSVFIA